MAKDETNKPLPSEVASLTDAVKELTKAVTENVKETTNIKEELIKLRKSGRF